jgi:hypothetical protein
MASFKHLAQASDRARGQVGQPSARLMKARPPRGVTRPLTMYYRSSPDRI